MDREGKFIIQTFAFVIETDAQGKSIDLGNLKGVIDFSIKNGGSSAITVNINGAEITTLAVGDPMLMLGGYQNAYRRDIIKLTFSGGSGRAECYANKRVSEATCLI